MILDGGQLDDMYLEGALACSWFSDDASMAASPTLRPIPGGRQVPEDGGG